MIKEIKWEIDDRYTVKSDGHIYNKKGLKLKCRVTKMGYLDIRINKKTYLMHRMIAIAFLGETTKRCVNHINGNKTDNRVENLEWVTHKENTNHAWLNGLSKGRGKIILDTVNGIYYNSAKEASNMLSISHSTIKSSCNGRCKNYLNLKYV